MRSNGSSKAGIQGNALAVAELDEAGLGERTIEPGNDVHVGSLAAVADTTGRLSAGSAGAGAGGLAVRHLFNVGPRFFFWSHEVVARRVAQKVLAQEVVGG